MATSLRPCNWQPAIEHSLAENYLPDIYSMHAL
jgi:hypothetical protein